MKKVFIVHGLGSSPNGGWRPWLMGELKKQHVYACALAMPTPDEPVCAEWVEEIARHVEKNANDEIFLVGHSLGVSAILRYLETAPEKIRVSGVVLVSGRCTSHPNKKLANFFEPAFHFATIASRARSFTIIHGDDDQVVPFDNAEILSRELHAELIVIPKGGHLNGGSGWQTLPACLDTLIKMMGSSS